MTIYVDGAYGGTTEKLVVYLPRDMADDLQDWTDLSDESLEPVISKALKSYVAKHKKAIEEYRAFVSKYRKATK